MPGAVFLEGNSINLRTVEREDMEKVRDIFNNQEVMSNLGHNKPANLEQEEDFFEDQVNDNSDMVNLAICKDENLVGLISIKEKRGQGIGEIGIWIDPEYHGQGIGTESSELLIDYAFKELRYHKVVAKAYESNKASQKIWEKLGFEKEGVLREQAFRKGSYEDVIVFGIISKNY